MIWAIPAAMAAFGAINGAHQRDEQVRQNLAQAETTRYSPWTGMKGQLSAVTASPMSGAVGGAASGFAFGQQFGDQSSQSTPSQPSQLQSLGQQNAPLFNAGRFDQLQGMQSVGSPWAFMGNRTA